MLSQRRWTGGERKKRGRAWKLRWRGQLSEAWKSQCNCHPGASKAGGHRSCALLASSHGGVYPYWHARAARLGYGIDMRRRILRVSRQEERLRRGRRPVCEQPRARFHEFAGVIRKMLAVLG